MNRYIKKKFFAKKLPFLFWTIFLALLPCFAATNNSISGSVRNATTAKPAAEDEVVLLRLLDGMQEEARTRTDAQGGFSLNVQFPSTRYLVRVVHQGVNYDQEVSAGSTVTIDVFDAASKVKGISGRIEIIRVGSQSNSLHISDMYDIKNESNPPVTQASEHTFEVYLPAKAKIDSVLAASPRGGGVKISATTVKGEPGHYTMNFPLRPGETKFAVNYDLPYAGRADFHPRLAYPVQQLAVMFSPSMTFRAPSTGFHSIIDNKDLQVQAVNQVEAGEGPSFEISGNGVLPPINGEAKPRSNAQLLPPIVSRPAAAGNNFSAANASKPLPASAIQNPKQTQFSLEWLIVGVVTVILLGIFVLRTRLRGGRQNTAVAEMGSGRADHSAALIAGLKEELFKLEKDRIHGSISREEYTATKQALDETVRRAIAKAATQKS
ncbi:MAG TPA: carboxypeptidase-like regulatory domain-containing protein [Terriglobales bacterium]|jgi:hypothetical protein|nr:carboxypeptidase-like regulatory domain-containing protein [Terriglobales bacterium]